MFTNATSETSQLDNDSELVGAAIPAETRAALVEKYRQTPGEFTQHDVAPFAAAYGVGADQLFNALCRVVDAGRL